MAWTETPALDLPLELLESEVVAAALVTLMPRLSQVLARVVLLMRSFILVALSLTLAWKAATLVALLSNFSFCVWKHCQHICFFGIRILFGRRKLTSQVVLAALACSLANLAMDLHADLSFWTEQAAVRVVLA